MIIINPYLIKIRIVSIARELCISIIYLATLPPGSKYSIADLRRMEADLKRKSDLLSEVKVLLAQAADRERSLINEREEAKIKVLSTHSIIG